MALANFTRGCLSAFIPRYPVACRSHVNGTWGSRHERRYNVSQSRSVEVRKHRVDLRLVWTKEKRDLGHVDAAGRTLGPNSMT